MTATPEEATPEGVATTSEALEDIPPETKYASFLEESSHRAEQEHDFGSVVQGDVIEHTFTAINNDSMSAELGTPLSSLPCCMQAKLSTSSLEPGQVADLKVTMKTYGRPGGNLEANVVVPVNESSTPLVFRLKGSIKSVIAPEPVFVNFPATGLAVVSIRSERFRSGLKIGDIVPSDAKLIIKPGKRSATAQEFTLDASALDQGALGGIQFLTNDPKIPDIQVGYQVSQAAK